jgi:hypothetical protein
LILFYVIQLSDVGFNDNTQWVQKHNVTYLKQPMTNNEEFYEDFLIFEVERELKLIKNEKFNREYELINREIQYYGKEICNIA